MLIVKIELHSAITGKTSEIGRMIIHNDGSGTSDRGNYKALIGRRGQTLDAAIVRNPQREAAVHNYPRLSYTVWELVRRALNAVYAKKASEPSSAGLEDAQ